MVYLTLKQQKFKEIHMQIDVNEKTKMELESTFSFNVNYSEDDAACIANLRQEIKWSNEPSKFTIIVDAVGFYTCEGIISHETKKEAHIQSYMQLFPYVQGMISQMTVSAGMPPLMIDMAKMDADGIKIENHR